MATPGGLVCTSEVSAGAMSSRMVSPHRPLRPLQHCRLCSGAHRAQLWQGLQLPCTVPGNGGAMASGNQAGGNVEQVRSKLESLFVTDTFLRTTEEGVDPTGLPCKVLAIGNMPRCPVCEAKGAIQCATCTGSGLYVDSILESQGIIVKVRCLGCGGSGDILCPRCGGRGHV